MFVMEGILVPCFPAPPPCSPVRLPAYTNMLKPDYPYLEFKSVNWVFGSFTALLQAMHQANMHSQKSTKLVLASAYRSLIPPQSTTPTSMTWGSRPLRIPRDVQSRGGSMSSRCRSLSSTALKAIVQYSGFDMHAKRMRVFLLWVIGVVLSAGRTTQGTAPRRARPGVLGFGRGRLRDIHAAFQCGGHRE